jgi:two-component system response regulator DevR
VVRCGLKDLPEVEGEFEAVGDASTAAEALARVPAVRPQVAVLYVRLPDGDGVTVCREMCSRMSELACLMLTSFSDGEALFDAIIAGACGYLLKQVGSTDLVGAVRTAAASGSLLDSKLAASVVDRDDAERDRSEVAMAPTTTSRASAEALPSTAAGRPRSTVVRTCTFGTSNALRPIPLQHHLTCAASRV